MIETVKISEKAKLQLITLKKRTGIQNWNTLCRCALALSLKEKSPPPNEVINTDSNVEMTWKTFTGGKENLYLNLIIFRAQKDGLIINKIELNQYFKLHLHRGISYLNSRANNLVELFEMTTLKN
jgi:DNA sulfur modification protein DndE